MRKLIPLTFFLLAFSYGQLSAQKILVPDDHPHIQFAIDASEDGDTILVAPGEYFENLNMKGKNVVLASHFLISGEVETINQTIINGSQPEHDDTASCILIVSGENENCVICGFTLTGGTGTRWKDEHNPSLYYTEGGGILIQYSSPVIRNNVIRENTANKKNSRNTSSGGGAIRMGDSNPKILSNMIHHNEGRYGAGIVLNYSGAIIRNNLIFSNSGGRDFGGGGLWIIDNGEAPIIIENNTIVNNSAGANYGGGVRIWNSEAVLNNNIIRGNTAKYGPQVHGSGTLAYCNIEGGKEGFEIIDEAIDFEYPMYYLPAGSSSIDGGNPHSSYNDKEDLENSGKAISPSKGSVRNDLGAYGGPEASFFPEPDLTGFQIVSNKSTGKFRIYPNPTAEILMVEAEGLGSELTIISLFDLTGKKVYEIQPHSKKRLLEINIANVDLTPGLYFVRIVTPTENAFVKVVLQ